VSLNELNHDEATGDSVQGERDSTGVTRTRSIQSRLSSVLALALMSTLGLGTLGWYYANALMRPDRMRQNSKSHLAGPAQGEMVLPALGRIDPPPSGAGGERDLPMDAPATPTTLSEIPLSDEALVAPSPMRPQGYAPGAAQVPTDRRLLGTAFATSNTASGPSLTPGNGAAPMVGPAEAAGAGELSVASSNLATLLRPTTTPAVRAQVLPTRRLLLPKGAFIDCTLETAIDSTLPGMTTCVLATDNFGADGQVVLLERGTKLVGETRGQVQQGAARLFVLWTEARTPTGVVVPLDSPGSDELGRAGMSGKANRHFWERFGAALLVSVIDGAVQAAAQNSRSGTVVVSPQGSQGVMTEVLKNTINISPTVTKPQGDRIQVLVARDVDFRSVYELRGAPSNR